MAESDKGDTDKAKTSTDTAKTKSSLLDEDISKDFLSSWKSMPVTGGSDMDFDLEPVAKGNKKAFDFDMDMDFSLDDAFGKMSSFKLDMPDIDFSSSPKKSSISKEKKPDRETAKESHQDKNDKFNFSFDFDGFGDFNLDEPAVKDRKNATEEKSSKQAADNSSLYIIESEDLPSEAATSREPKKEDASHKEHPNSEVAVNSKHDPLVEQEPFVAPSNYTIAVDNEQEEIHISVNKTVFVDAQQLDHESAMAGETDSKISRIQARAHDFCSNPESSILPMLVDSEEANTSPETNGVTIPQGMEEDFHLTEEKTSEQVFAEIKDQVPLVKVSEEACASPETNGITTIKGMEENVHLTEKKISEQAFDEANRQAPMVNASGLLVMDSETPDDELCSANEKIDAGSSEVGPIKEQFVAGALSSADAKTATPDKSSTPCLTEKMSLNGEGKVVEAVEKMGDYTLTLDTLASPATRICKTMKSEVSLNAKLQKSDEKNSPTPADSEPPSTTSLKTRNKLCGSNNFSVVRGKTDGGGTKHLTLEKNNRGSTLLRAVDLSIDLSNDGNGKKLDDHPSSCDKESTARESAAKRREKSADVLRAGDSNGNGEIQAKMTVDAVLSDGQANRDSFRLLDRRKMSIDVKPSR